MNVGNTVKIVGPQEEPDYYDWYLWDHTMDEYIGKIATITEIDSIVPENAVILDIDNGSYGWLNKWLELIPSKDTL